MIHGLSFTVIDSEMRAKFAKKPQLLNTEDGQNGPDGQDGQDGHLNLTFQETCEG